MSRVVVIADAGAGLGRALARHFGALFAQRGIDLGGRPTSHSRPVAEVVLSLTRLPADIAVPIIQLDGIRAGFGATP